MTTLKQGMLALTSMGNRVGLPGSAARGERQKANGAGRPGWRT